MLKIKNEYSNYRNQLYNLILSIKHPVIKKYLIRCLKNKTIHNLRFNYNLKVNYKYILNITYQNQKVVKIHYIKNDRDYEEFDIIKKKIVSIIYKMISNIYF